jgi:sugar (glycoside-pentoside-hexuronide) transporter
LTQGNEEGAPSATPSGDTQRRDQQVSWSTLGLYGLPGMGVNFLFSLILILYMKFATDELGVSPGMMGMIFFIARIWDAVSDPVAGSWSDRTKSRLGRRKSWMLASSLPLAVTAIAMWSPPESLSETEMAIWIGVSVIGFYTAYTLFEVPHMALGAELTQDTRSRVRVFGARQLMRTFGLFVAGSLGAALLEDPADPRSAAFGLVCGAGLFTTLTIVFSVFKLPPEREEYVGRGGAGILRSLHDVWLNRHARMLLFIFFLETMGSGAIGVLAPYVITYVVKTPALLSEMLIAYMLPALLSIPMWIRLGGRYEKRRLWLVGISLGGFGFGLLFFLTEGSYWLVFFAAGIAGIGNGCGATLGQALKADVIDMDEYRTGERKEGAYFATWNFVSKLAAGVMMGVVGLSLQWVGFVPNAEQAPMTEFTMRFLMGGVPFIGFGIAAVVLSRFDLSEAEHARVISEIDARSRVEG